MWRLSRRVVLQTLAFCAILSAAGCGVWKKSELVLIPDGYIGWIRIEYGVPGAPKLQEKDGAYEIHIPQTGRFETSTPMSSGLANDKYFYVLADGNNERQLGMASDANSSDGMVRARHYFGTLKAGGQRERNLRVFFIGTLSDYNIAPKSESDLLQ